MNQLLIIIRDISRETRPEGLTVDPKGLTLFLPFLQIPHTGRTLATVTWTAWPESEPAPADRLGPRSLIAKSGSTALSAISPHRWFRESSVELDQLAENKLLRTRCF